MSGVRLTGEWDKDKHTIQDTLDRVQHKIDPIEDTVLVGKVVKGNVVTITMPAPGPAGQTLRIQHNLGRIPRGAVIVSYATDSTGKRAQLTSIYPFKEAEWTNESMLVELYNVAEGKKYKVLVI